MVSSITCGVLSIKRACPTKCFGYGEIVDVFLQSRRDGATAKRFFRRLLRSNAGEPRKIVTDKLRSYGVAHRELIPDTIHISDRYANNRAEHSQSLPLFMGMSQLGFESEGCGDSNELHKFVTTHASVSNLFNLQRH